MKKLTRNEAEGDYKGCPLISLMTEVGQEAKLKIYGRPLSERLPEPTWGLESMPRMIEIDLSNVYPIIS
ncbi:hypothetical protein JXB41_06020 [Candidatus Woesearchaeota archaeon]|nr:hypothetical protein [Candidatus Woesearchaeota archaeon]